MGNTEESAQRKEDRFSRIDAKRFLRDSILLSLLNCIILLGLLYYGENNILKVRKQNLEAEITSVLAVEDSLLGDEIDSILSDVGFLNENYRNRLSSHMDISNTAEDWSAFSRNRKIYDQIRFINCAGDEIIRINYDDGRGHRIPDALLQNKADRYYFIETIGLRPGQVFISRLDLNEEYGEIEIPYKPVIRACAPVYTSENVLIGVIVLNYKAENLLESFETLADISGARHYLLNVNGYWLSSPDKSQEWTFMFEDKTDISFKNTYPDAWAQMEDNDRVYYDEDGLFAHTHLYFDEKITNNQSMVEADRVILDEGHWIIVIYEPATGNNRLVVAGNVWRISFEVLKKYVTAFILFVCISFLFTFFRCRLKRARERITYFSTYDSLTGVYNRRAGLGKLEAYMDKPERRERRLAVVFLDVNGLKVVNDTFGHLAGDELILSVTKVLKETIREDDYIVRMGGDEFLLVLSNADRDGVKSTWRRITQKIDEVNENKARPYQISISHGVAVVDEHKGKSANDLIRIADEAMYVEKQSIKKHLKVIRATE